MLARAKTFDLVRARTLALSEQRRSTTKVLRGEGAGIVVSLVDPTGTAGDQFIAYYVDPKDSWKTLEYFGCPS